MFLLLGGIDLSLPAQPSATLSFHGRLYMGSGECLGTPTNFEQICALQEAQLSQRDPAMLLVIEYFGKSLEVIHNDILE